MTGHRLRAAEQACAQLAARGEQITFVTVAQRTGIPRVTLYRNPALRAVVEEHRARERDATTLTGLAAQLASPAAHPPRTRRQDPPARRTPPETQPAQVTGPLPDMGG